jgi:hypothetical protein
LFIDERLDLRRLLVAHADDRDAAFLVFFLQLSEVWDALSARWTPCRPKFHDHNFFSFRCRKIDWIALDPLGNFQWGGGVAQLSRVEKGSR